MNLFAIRFRTLPNLNTFSLSTRKHPTVFPSPRETFLISLLSTLQGMKKKKKKKKNKKTKIGKGRPVMNSGGEIRH